MAEQKIALAVGGVDYDFKMTTEDYNRFINEMATNNKVVPATKLIKRTLVDRKQLETLQPVLDKGRALEIASLLVEEFSGEIEIEVKK